MNPSEKPRRRPRYRGTHPRKFSEKYKELAPDRFPETVQKVLTSGKTPAGAHRPICVREILEVLHPQPGEIAVDATLGYGGHASKLLDRLLPGGRLIGIDTDPLELPKTEARLRALAIPPESLVTRHTNYAALPNVLADLEVSGVDIILADLGCSSMQLDNPARGFSFKLDGPLDLRMNPHKGQPAAQWLNATDESRLARILAEYADEPNAAPLARGILAAHAQKPLAQTSDLARAIQDILFQLDSRAAAQDATATTQRVFQALRIAVNDELSALRAFLRYLPDCLKPGGRVAILSFHSGEDRLVKHAFQEGARSGLYQSIAADPIRPSPAEIHDNPRAASAKLRWAVKNSQP